MDCDCCYRNSCDNFCSMHGRNVGDKGKCLEDTGRTSGKVYSFYINDDSNDCFAALNSEKGAATLLIS